MSTSPSEPLDTQGDCGRDAGAYVLGALDPNEVEDFRRHLAGCVVCRDEVAALGAVVEALPMAAPQLAVNRALRRRVMADVRSARRAAARERAGARTLGLPAPALGRAAAALSLAGGIVVALVLAFGGSGHGRLVQASVAPPSASAVVRIASGRAELLLRRMPAPPAGEIYEVWEKAGGGPPIATTALFDVTSAGGADVDVPGDPHHISAVLVTAERRGGSARPTHAPVIVVRLT